MTRVKVCGLTRLDDAAAAVAAGADYLGFIFYPPSPRAVTVDAAAALLSALRDHPDAAERMAGSERPRLVGVFVNETPAEVADVLERCGLDLAQLSGDEPPDDAVDPKSPLFGRAYKAVRAKSLAAAEDAAERFVPHNADAPSPSLLLDTPHGALYGGSGQAGDWGLAAVMARRVPGLMLAGGLSPDNVVEAVRRVRPFAVDVASGVEAAPGRKDHDKVRAFITLAHHAFD